MGESGVGVGDEVLSTTQGPQGPGGWGESVLRTPMLVAQTRLPRLQGMEDAACFWGSSFRGRLPKPTCTLWRHLTPYLFPLFPPLGGLSLFCSGPSVTLCSGSTPEIPEPPHPLTDTGVSLRVHYWPQDGSVRGGMQGGVRASVCMGIWMSVQGCIARMNVSALCVYVCTCAHMYGRACSVHVRVSMHACVCVWLIGPLSTHRAPLCGAALSVEGGLGWPPLSLAGGRQEAGRPRRMWVGGPTGQGVARGGSLQDLFRILEPPRLRPTQPVQPAGRPRPWPLQPPAPALRTSRPLGRLSSCQMPPPESPRACWPFSSRCSAAWVFAETLLFPLPRRKPHSLSCLSLPQDSLPTPLSSLFPPHRGTLLAPAPGFVLPAQHSPASTGLACPPCWPKPHCYPPCRAREPPSCAGARPATSASAFHWVPAGVPWEGLEKGSSPRTPLPLAPASHQARGSDPPALSPCLQTC